MTTAELRQLESSLLRHDTSGCYTTPTPPIITAETLWNCVWEPHAVVRGQVCFEVAVMTAATAGSSKGAHNDGAPQRKKKGPGALATAYLVIYNVVMTAGYVTYKRVALC